MEMQRGVVGELSKMRDLADAVAASGTLANLARLVKAARAHEVRVVHCTAQFRADMAGSATNSPMLAVLARQPGHLLAGSPESSVVPELGPEPADLISPRHHGVSPFAGTELDITLRNLSVSTVIATGVSLNLGIIGLALEAVNLGYRVVVATDTVAGTPPEYAEAVMTHTIPLLATRCRVDEVIAAWEAGGATAPAAAGPRSEGG